MVSIIRIDMSLTDEKVLSVLREKLGSKSGEITLQEIADAVGCSRQTAFNAVTRLKNTGRLSSRWQRQSKPCIYQVLDE